MDVRKRFGKRFKELRHEKGLSREALARLLALDTSSISARQMSTSKQALKTSPIFRLPSKRNSVILPPR
jgi:transcriptional regulator with XRE-family HTH domain